MSYVYRHYYYYRPLASPAKGSVLGGNSANMLWGDNSVVQWSDGTSMTWST